MEKTTRTPCLEEMLIADGSHHCLSRRDVPPALGFRSHVSGGDKLIPLLVSIFFRMLARAVASLIGLGLIVLGAGTAASNRIEVFCTDYCTGSVYNRIQALNDNYRFWAYFGLFLVSLGLIALLWLLPSLKFRLLSITSGVVASLASGLATFREPIYAASGVLLSITEKSGLPLAYRVTFCIQAPLSYCPGGVYSKLDWFPFLSDTLFFVAVAYVLAFLHIENKRLVTSRV